MYSANTITGDIGMISLLNSLNFSLAKGVLLRTNDNAFSLISETPVRVLRISPALYGLIKKISEGQDLFELIKDKPVSERKSVTSILLTLVAKGYLSIQYKRCNEYLSNNPGRLEHCDALKQCNGHLPYGQNGSFKNSISASGYDEILPTVTVVIPVKNRPGEIRDCLDSLKVLNYPKEKMEIIVVDDGSTDSTGDIIASYNVKLISLPKSKGASACRNIGVKEAKGEIIAFLDSDCTVSPGWIKELLPYFAFEGVGAVGGFVNSYYNSSCLDKYEAACSSLNMGKRVLFERDAKTNFYVPSCNLFVKKDAFNQTGGFKESMHVGEDVDFCWRMRKLGYFLLYVPQGVIAHKHRNILAKMLKRRMEYGTSEADLYKKHSDKEKVLPVPVYEGLSFLSFLLAICMTKPLLLAVNALLLPLGVFAKAKKISEYRSEFGYMSLLKSFLRSTFSVYYFIFFHLMRYYLLLMLAAGVVYSPVWHLAAISLVISSIVDYSVKKPDISFAAFLCFYALEHLAYQTGVLGGCLKQKSFKCYKLKIKILL
jgi:mycofactocin system glycosyltransferase